ncbi:MAG TPA: dihydropteroate synthase [Methanomassiliicoccales archaeon]|nr:dihydropteroate synthase [Methanomassiliicoccales archaeon]
MARVRTYRNFQEAWGEWRRLGIPDRAFTRFDLASRQFLFVDSVSKEEVSALQEELAPKKVTVLPCRGDRAVIAITPLTLESLMVSGASPMVMEIGEALRYRHDIEPPLFEWSGGFLKLSKPRVVGILNVTPDSFSDGGQSFDADTAVDCAMAMKEEGADIIDIGGESTRPGSTPVSSDEEWSRISDVVRRVSEEVGLPVSVDTRRPDVARKALRAGAVMVNDISGLREEMIEVVRDEGAAAIVMHMRGEPSNMQEDTRYVDVVGDVYAFLENRVKKAIAAGIPAERLAIDPGLGFAKDIDGNLEIMSRLDEFRSLGRPVLLGASRKTFLGKIAGGDPDDRLEASLAAVSVACWQGVHLFRVHDVKETVRTLKAASAMRAGISPRSLR